MDCTDPKAQPRCQKSHINAFPSVLVFRDGKTHSHEAYHSDRTADALIKFIEGLRKDKGLPAPDPNVVKVVEKEVPATLPKASPGPKVRLDAGIGPALGWGGIIWFQITPVTIFFEATKCHVFVQLCLVAKIPFWGNWANLCHASHLSDSPDPPCPVLSNQGCMIAGSVLVRKIPGNLVFTAASKSHSFTRELIDTSHVRLSLAPCLR